MSEYTEMLSDVTNDIDLLEDCEDINEYFDKLAEVAGSFRSFGDALTLFIVKHGFEGDKDNIAEKIDFLNNKFKEENINVEKRGFRHNGGSLAP